MNQPSDIVRSVIACVEVPKRISDIYLSVWFILRTSYNVKNVVTNKLTMLNIAN